MFLHNKLIPQVLFSIAILNNNMSKPFTQNVCILSASDWFKLLMIFTSFLRVRVIPNNSLTSEDVWIKTFSGTEVELGHKEYEGLEEGNLCLTKMNGEYHNLFENTFIKFEKPRRGRVLNSGFTEVTVCSARFGIITLFQLFVTTAT